MKFFSFSKIFQIWYVCSLQACFVLFIYKEHFQKFSSKDYFVIFVTIGMFDLNIILHFGQNSDREQKS